MSHFIGLVFVDTEANNLDDVLAPFNEQDDDYCEFVDKTDEVTEKFTSLPEKDNEDEKYPCDLAHYPTIDALAKEWFGYTMLDGKYGYLENPDAKWDWYCQGGRWGGYIKTKDGNTSDCISFDEIDWDAMTTGEEKEYENFNGEKVKYIDDHIPLNFVDMDGNWHEKGEIGWWGCVSNEKEPTDWDDEFKDFIKSIQSMTDEERANILVYAIDFHI